MDDRIPCHIIWGGCVPYHQAWAWQRDMVVQRAANEIPDTLLLLEHPPTITLGRAANPAHVCSPAPVLEQHGITLVQTDRGGDVTYHAPGQLVGYPILKLKQYHLSPVHYLRQLETLLIQTLATYDLVATRQEGLTGVWVNGKKIAAIGVRFSSTGITSHGFALNISLDMRGFDHIIPCGLRHHQVTSLAYECSPTPSLLDVAERIIAVWPKIFGIISQSTYITYRQETRSIL